MKRPAAVCMVVYSYYPADPRVRKEAESLAGHGYTVDVVCLRKDGEPKAETINRVNVHRISLQSDREGGQAGYAIRYTLFFIISSAVVALQNLRKRYLAIHAHSLPDFLVFTAALPKLAGAKAILDLHEAMPEIYSSKMGGLLKGPMQFIENVSTGFADKVVTVSDCIGDILRSRGLRPDKLTIIYNTPDIDSFLPPTEESRTKLVYAGALNEWQDFDTMIEAVNGVEGITLDIFGDGIKRASIERRIKELDTDRIRLKGWVPSKELRKQLPCYRGALLPFIDSPITRIALGNKSLEYSMLGLPVVATDLPGLRSLFDDSCFYFYKAGDAADARRAIQEMLSDQGVAKCKVSNFQKVMRDKGLTWSAVEGRLFDLYDGMLEKA